MLIAIFSLVFMDIFDTLGTLVGTANKVGMVKPDGSIPKLKPAMMADAVGTTFGALLGTSTTTTYAESTAGIAEGGRSGLTAAVVSGLFIVAPFFLLVPGIATAGVLVIVGSFMFDAVKKIRFDDMTEAFPAFVTIIMMPLTYSIAEGIVLGLLTYVLLKLFAGKYRELNLTMYILSILCILKYVFV